MTDTPSGVSRRNLLELSHDDTPHQTSHDFRNSASMQHILAIKSVVYDEF